VSTFPIAVSVELAQTPDGALGVLVQLPDGYVVIDGPGARRLAAMLLDAADAWDQVNA